MGFVHVVHELIYFFDISRYKDSEALSDIIKIHKACYQTERERYKNSNKNI